MYGVFPSAFSSVQSLSRVRLFVTPWIAACQASLSITNSWSLPKPMPSALLKYNWQIICSFPFHPSSDVFVWIWCQSNTASQSKEGWVPSSSIFRSLWRVCINSSLNIWWNWLMRLSGSGLLFVGSFLITGSILLLVAGLFGFSFYSSVSFDSLCLPRNLSTSSNSSNLLAWLFIVFSYNPFFFFFSPKLLGVFLFSLPSLVILSLSISLFSHLDQSSQRYGILLILSKNQLWVHRFSLLFFCSLFH